MNERTEMRLEDLRLVTGRGRYVSDFIEPETCFAGFFRSDVASGRIEGLDVSQALGMPGVIAVFTSADLDADGIAAIAHVDLPRDDGLASEQFPQPILSGEEIKHTGEPIALVVAETRESLAAALETIVLDIGERDPVQGIAFLRRLGDAQAVKEAFARAAHRSTVMVDMPRATTAAMEPRGAIATPDATGGLHFRASTQNPFAMRNQIAGHLGWDEDSLHVQADDVGGSFGLKGAMSREDVALCWAARRLDRQLAWLPGRSESFLADAQGRGAKGRVSIALDEHFRILAVEADFEVDVGAYPGRRAFGLVNNINGLTGMYDIPAAAARVVGRLSARAPLAPFRGNGRPEATYAIEKAIDQAARQLGINPVALRRKNLIRPDAMPVVTALGARIDCGDFPKVMDTALSLNEGNQERRKSARERGLLFGLGIVNCIESAGGPLKQPKPDFARITVGEDGRVVVAPGVMSVGQGHETALTHMTAGRLQIDIERIDYRNGDTRALSFGRGSGGSSGLTVAGSALWQALDRLLDEGCADAAAVMNCPVRTVMFRDGAFHREGSNESVPLERIAAAKQDGNWQVETSFTPAGATFPNGTHICEVEIDPETGETRIVRYVAVEDIGTIMYPMLVEGQLHGGIAQGLSLGLGERIIYDDADQLLTGSLMDYQMARADNLPDFFLAGVEVPTALNPLGVKGVGEAGTVGATAALASAVCDALFSAGVSEFELPATPSRVWEALRDARSVEKR
ncbi:xanthine dehydrogenase family protein molybdopterin-binding subunit [Roseibium marinum]|uniref:Carbon-monoxide dehydrogenase large subunit n=1 Tax=Roseibium marinum TaxID=281252 RepID=A0A2S3V3C9_9HYPH|nr:xanthine dehydrogenase family protein molybdopterin-binding subunit [Roseibium marinum]POF34492.1 carbon-monoxide dehydrogenase large subunit [Roseibium marinum]